MPRTPLPRPQHPRAVPALATVLAFAAALALLAAQALQPAAALVHPTALEAEHDPAAADGDYDAQLHCLALNIYHEARSEPREGRLAVATVTLNRVRSPEFPDTICRVVWQRGQFSWTHDGKPDVPYNDEAWLDALRLARVAYVFVESDLVGGATFFHTVDVTPGWARAKRRVARVGRHVFYERR